MSKISKLMKELFIFRNVTDEEIEHILSYITADVKEYSKGDIIFSRTNFENSIGFVLDGKCAVKQPRSDNSFVVLNTLEKYDSFGITAAFSDRDYFPTEVVAVKNTKMLFISKQNILWMTVNIPKISHNIIEFLVDRINFLNKKIDTFTKVSTDDKLASYIMSEYRRRGEQYFSFNCKKAGEILNMGRASVYRALSSLAESGVITYSENKIYINDPDGLERNQK